MYCNHCENTLENCTCENLEERLDKAVETGHFDYNKCLKCGKHYARCKCDIPKLILASVYNRMKKDGVLLEEQKHD